MLLVVVVDAICVQWSLVFRCLLVSDVLLCVLLLIGLNVVKSAWSYSSDCGGVL